MFPRLLLAAGLLAACSSQPSPPPPTMAAIDEIAARYTQDDTFAGVVLAGTDGEAIHAAAYGETAAGSGVPHRLGSEWRWASVTKMVAGFLTLQEIEKGKLALDGPITDVLSDAPPHFEGVTLRQLLSHTSGLADPDEQVPDPETGAVPFVSRGTPDFAYCRGAPLAEPGAGFNYNACDFLVLAEVLEAVTGQTFDVLVRERIAERYGLPSIRVVTQKGDEAEVQGTVGGLPHDDPLELAALSADSAIVGQPMDLLKLTQLFVTGGIVTDPGLREEFGRGVPELGYVALTVWGQEAQLEGCSETLSLIERRGHLKGTKILTLQAPDLQRSLVAFSNRDETDWGWIWAREGFAYELASTVFCSSAASEG
ncbi:serine hydrolase domain-containing protein [Parvularcula maris]|uniref:Beta-lactamase family protein n=1 Tax=Parvularcula maris TaxID=2965077 RepID=A0A9X2LA34_9PROT|nr:serine hydrolase domain-containing protein [Parvularcula maris]MCQ8185901.1 beta-lactamase family protein [Parvularcula maris]